MKDGLRQDEPVDQRDRDADLTPRLKMLEHPISFGAVQQNAILLPGVQRGNQIRLAVEGKPDVTNQRFIDDRIDCRLVVATAMRDAANLIARGLWEFLCHWLFSSCGLSTQRRGTDRAPYFITERPC